MSYASFRCFIKAPLGPVWQKLKDFTQRKPGLALGGNPLDTLHSSSEPLGDRLEETADVIEERYEIQWTLTDQNKNLGTRKLRLMESEQNGVILEYVLDWQDVEKSLQTAFDPHLESIVRTPLIAFKKSVEDQAG